jgi:hypothetical protein
MKGIAIKYSNAELEWVSDNRTLTISELHNKFFEKFRRKDVLECNLKSLKQRKGWKTGRTGQFEKGNIPHPNAGPKGPNKTSFKRGNRPHNWRPVGSKRLSKDGSIEIKTKEPKTWESLHVIIWAEKNGKIPDGYCVVFKNNDKTDTRLENLELVSRNENLQINRLHCSSMEEETKPVIRSIGKLIAKTNEAKKCLTK